jgi:chromate transporter
MRPRRGAASVAPAWIDDHSPTPAHARYSRQRLLAVLGAGALLWGCAMAALVWGAGGWHGTLAQMGRFFTQAALVTFGGAYAVLPYVFEAAVQQHGWLSAPQMIDGLALGESTPGPLIMVVAFVGFLGGWQGEVLGAGPSAQLAAGVLAACVATFFTFLPSFVFILAGGPLVEATHGKLGFTAPLAAISAAVVGVIVNLALFFAWHVLWPQGWNATALFAGLDAWALALMAAAAVALWRYAVGVLPLLGAAALLGLVISLAR